MNISDQPAPVELQLADLLKLIGEPTRIRILLAIGDAEACVCHLEAATGMRQAAISQHLMLLRKAGLVSPNRAGRNIYYSLSNPKLLELVRTAAGILDLPSGGFENLRPGTLSGCPCPRCQTKQSNTSQPKVPDA